MAAAMIADQDLKKKLTQDFNDINKANKKTYKRKYNNRDKKVEEQNNNQSKKARVLTGDHKTDLFSSYQPWVIHTYGDLAKTKTITLKKFARILRVLRGEECNSSDSSKFRFWVKAKGFHVGKPHNYEPKPADGIICRYSVLNADGCRKNEDGSEIYNGSSNDPALYIPTPPVKNAPVQETVYRKVAIVENFFDIIYTVHVELEGKAGKHAGQKRTYRTITESYAFLPREAVTKFLMGCTECQRRPRSISPVIPQCNSPVIDKSEICTRNWESEIDRHIDKKSYRDTIDYSDTTHIDVGFDDCKSNITNIQDGVSIKSERKFNPLDVCNLTSKDPPREKSHESSLIKTNSLSKSRLSIRNGVLSQTNNVSTLGASALSLTNNSESFSKSGLSLSSDFRINFGSDIDYRVPITTTYWKHMRNLATKNFEVSRSL